MSPRGGGILWYTCYLGSVHRLTHLGRLHDRPCRAAGGSRGQRTSCRQPSEPDLGGAQGPDAVHRYRYVINSKHSNLAVEICDFTFLDSARHKVTTETSKRPRNVPRSPDPHAELIQPNTQATHADSRIRLSRLFIKNMRRAPPPPLSVPYTPNIHTHAS